MWKKTERKKKLGISKNKHTHTMVIQEHNAHTRCLGRDSYERKIRIENKNEIDTQPMKLVVAILSASYSHVSESMMYSSIV